MQPQRVVLYNPVSEFYTMPLGLLAVGSALDPERYDVQIIDGRLENNPLEAVIETCKGALCLGITRADRKPHQQCTRDFAWHQEALSLSAYGSVVFAAGRNIMRFRLSNILLN